MLKKLLKYDLQNVYKVLIVFYSLSLFFSILTRIFLSIENSFIMNIIGQICSGTTIAMIFNIFSPCTEPVTLFWLSPLLD